MKSFSKIFSYLKDQWRLGISYFLLNLLGVIFSVVSFTMAIPFLKFLFQKENSDTVLVKPDFQLSANGIVETFQYYMALIVQEHGQWGGLIFICITLVITTFLKNLFLYLSQYLLTPIRNNVVKNIRMDLYKKSLKLPMSFYSDERKGDLMTRMSVDITEVENALTSATQLLLREPFVIAVYLGVMIYISPMLTLFLLLFLPIVGFLIGKVSKSLKSQTLQNQSFLGDIMSIVEETFSGLRIIKSFNVEKLMSLKFLKLNNNIFRLQNSISRRKDLASPLSEFLGTLVLAIIILVGGYMIIHREGGLTSEGFIGFVIMFSQLITPLKNLSGIFYNMHKGKASLDRIEKILDAPDQQIQSEKNEPIHGIEKAIEYKNVNFKYGDHQVLKNINITIQKGKTIALVGASGSGKSTLVDLLSRLSDLTDGEILIDGVNIMNVGIENLRRQVGIVSQDPVLFNDTIFNNININQSHDKDIEDQVWEAARIAYADEFIRQKPGQMQFNVGDRGNKLSGGEKQRITIARAVLKNAPILVLDEATSALDTVSEKWVQKALENLMKNRTTIVIAHRLSTVKDADEILVMENGEIKERGTHIELIDQNGIYHELVKMQNLK